MVEIRAEVRPIRLNHASSWITSVSKLDIIDSL
jgi:hypothetical protein